MQHATPHQSGKTNGQTEVKCNRWKEDVEPSQAKNGNNRYIYERGFNVNGSTERTRNTGVHKMDVLSDNGCTAQTTRHRDPPLCTSDDVS